jgi:hypothetical protein
VFKDEVEAGQAVRALHYWNRRHHQGLGVTCVVVRRKVGGAKYRPYRVFRTRRGAWWGLVFGAIVVGLLGAGAAAATSSFIDTVSSWIKLVTNAITGWVGTGNAVDLGPMLRQASTFPYGAPVVIGLGGAVLGGLAGAIVFGFLGTIAHMFRGFRRSIRREVVAELEPGTAAVLAWARGSTAIVTRAELERLGGNAAPDQPPSPAAAASAAAAAAARPWAPPGS